MLDPKSDRLEPRTHGASASRAANAAAQGILVDREIKALIASGALRAERGIEADQIQPASIDLRLAFRGAVGRLAPPQRKAASSSMQPITRHASKCSCAIRRAARA